MTGVDLSANHANVLDQCASSRTFHVMAQACGEFTNQDDWTICDFDGDDDNVQKAFDQVLQDYNGDYVEAYPIDINAGQWTVINSLCQTPPPSCP